MPSGLWDLIAQLVGARGPSVEGGGSDPNWNPSNYAPPPPDPNLNATIAQLGYLQRLDQALGAMGNWQAAGYGLGAPMSFLPQAPLAPSQVQGNPYAGWYGDLPPGRQMPPGPVRSPQPMYDPVAQWQPYPWTAGLNIGEYVAPNTTYPYGPRFDQFNQPRPSPPPQDPERRALY